MECAWLILIIQSKICLHVIIVNTHMCIIVDGFATTTQVDCDYGLSIGSILIKCVN